MSSIKKIEGYKIYMNKILGKGSYGDVYEGISDTTNEKVAVKIMNKAASTHSLTQFMLTIIWKMPSSQRSRSWNR